MPENTLKNTTSWTEEHDIFCLRHNIPPSAQYLWRWLIRQGEIGKEVEPDLSQFNTWVETNRGESYDQPYLKEMFQLLESHRLIHVLKEFSWKVYRLIIRPLSWLNPPKKKERKNSNPLDSSPKVEPSNAQSTENLNLS
jgi:hypothetical protein